MGKVCKRGFGGFCCRAPLSGANADGVMGGGPSQAEGGEVLGGEHAFQSQIGLAGVQVR
jgi:hypothetical protein